MRASTDMSSTISTLRVLIYEQQSAFTTQGYVWRRTVSTGVGPGDVDHVVITHMHYDHVGNVARFPHATVSMAREEYDFWCGRDREPTTALVDPVEVEIVRKLAREERLNLVDGAEERVIAGHDPRVRSMFDEVRPGCLDLTAAATAD